MAIRSHPRGTAMIVTMQVLLLMAMTTTVLVQTTHYENQGTSAFMLKTQAEVLADAAVQYAVAALKVNKANRYPLPTPGLPSSFTSYPTNGVMMGYLPGYAPQSTPAPVCQYEVIQLTPERYRSTTDSDQVVHYYQRFVITAKASVPDPDTGTNTMDAYDNRMIDLDMVPLFQYLAFYNPFDLEMLPGATATFTGRIHSNFDIYMGVQPGNTLTYVSDSIRAHGNFFRRRKDNPNDYMLGSVQIKKKGAPASPINATNYAPVEGRGVLKTANGTVVPTTVAPDGYDSLFGGYDANGDGIISGPGELGSFASTVNSKYNATTDPVGTLSTGDNGVPKLDAPSDINSFRPPQPGEQANFRFDAASKHWVPASGAAATHVMGNFNQIANLVVRSDGTTSELVDSTGTVLYARPTSNAAETVNLLKDSAGLPITGLITESHVYDVRESTDVKVTDIDFSKLNKALKSGVPIYDPSSTSPGTIIYAYRTDTKPAVNLPYAGSATTGIRIVNAQTLNNKLTFATEDPLYVRGDFNKVANGKKASILMSDATNLLSNQWPENFSGGTLPKPGSSLEVNAAFMSGSYATKVGAYNGGFENFPRFHEDWGAVKTNGYSVNIAGSFVNLFDSKFATGAWGTGYTPPLRNWNFDTMFLDSINQPPGMPFSVGHNWLAWWVGQDTRWWP